ncbi:MAG: hypothetical protein ACOYOU_14905, partial [Kiritimatiellia bacterium]
MQLTQFTNLARRMFNTWHGRTVLGFAVVLAGAMAFIFFDVFAPGLVISSPDDSPFYAANYFVSQAELYLTDTTPFQWQRFFNILAPLFCHELAYMICLFLLGLSGVYYLRTQRVARLAAWGGGLFLALSGYICTLFCAG